MVTCCSACRVDRLVYGDETNFVQTRHRTPIAAIQPEQLVAWKPSLALALASLAHDLLHPRQHGLDAGATALQHHLLQQIDRALTARGHLLSEALGLSGDSAADRQQPAVALLQALLALVAATARGTSDLDQAALRLPMLRSAAGRAYLAWCPANEQRLILESLRASGHPDDARSHDPQWVRSLIANTRRRGYGERQEELVERTGAIAIPIRLGARVAACLSITFIASALTPQQAARRHLDVLRASAHEIETRLQRLGDDSSMR